MLLNKLLKTMKILFLTNNKNTYPLVKWLKQTDEVKVFSKKLTLKMAMKYDFLISYNYKFIIPDYILYLFPKGKAINLHISYLPFNKGSNPNFWSFIENTPKGITIHCLEKGLDTGDIIAQKEIKFDESKETLVSSYKKLHKLIKDLFKQKWSKIKSGKIKFKQQTGKDSYHNQADFEIYKNVIETNGWDLKIKELKSLYKFEYFNDVGDEL